ncbi:MAG: PEP-CTERM sorting domain-containing protein [Armatimonadetes bacterium]|nr:PEP-CTERM sorting domain-containing protein [Armatimonadota bacterium]
MRASSISFFALTACLAAARCSATVLFSNLHDTTATNGSLCFDGGQNALGYGAGVQAGQVITSSITGSLTRVEAIFGNNIESPSATGALVQIFKMSGGAVGSLVGQQQTSVSIIDLGIDKYPNGGSFDKYATDVTALVNISGLVAGSKYLVTLQPQGRDVWLLKENNNRKMDDYLRNYSSFGYSGLNYRRDFWIPNSLLLIHQGDAQMEIQGFGVRPSGFPGNTAVPEPCTLLGFGIAGVALVRRRKVA